MTPRSVLAAAPLALAAILASCGGTDATTADAPTRTINVAMVDNKFQPAALTLTVGDKVTFVFTNNGKVTHEAVLGDTAAQKAHEAEMAATTTTSMGMDAGMSSTTSMNMGSQMSSTTAMDMTGGSMTGHDMSSADAVTVAPGKTGKLTATFDKAGRYEIGCHEPGHYASGMKILISVN